MVQRNYDVSLPHNKIPDELCELVKKLAAPAMPAGDEFKPEAAIVNYFASGIKRNIYCINLLLFVWRASPSKFLSIAFMLLYLF